MLPVHRAAVWASPGDMLELCFPALPEANGWADSLLFLLSLPFIEQIFWHLYCVVSTK